MATTGTVSAAPKQGIFSKVVTAVKTWYSGLQTSAKDPGIGAADKQAYAESSARFVENVAKSESTAKVTTPRGGGSGGGGGGRGVSVAPTPAKVTPTTKKIFPTVEPIVKAPTITPKITPISKAEQVKKQSQTAWISAYKPMTQEEKLKQRKEPYGKQYFRKATQQEKATAGLGYSPFMGQGATYYETPDLSIGEVSEFQLTMASIPLKTTQFQTIRTTEAELTPKYQKRVTETTSQEELAQINKEFQADVLSTTQTKLSGSKEYVGKVGAYEKLSSDLNLPGLEATNYETSLGYKIKEFGIEKIPLYIAAPPVVPFSEALKEIQEQPNYYEGTPGVRTTKSEGYDAEWELSTKGKINIALGAGLALGGAGIQLSNLGKEITAMRLSEGQASKSFTLRKEIYNVGDESFYKSITRQKTSDYLSQTTQQYLIFAKGEGEFVIGAGKGTTKFKVVDFWKELRGSQDKFITGNIDFVAGGKGKAGETLLQGVELSGIRTTFGSGYVSTDKGIDNFLFGGISKQEGNVVKSIGGKATSLKIFTQPSIKIGSTGNVVGFDTSIPRMTAKIPIKNYALTFNLGSETSGAEGIGGAGKGFLSFKGGGAKSSQSFIQSLYSDLGGFSGSVTDVVGKQAGKGLITTTKGGSLFPLVSAASSTKTKTQQYQDYDADLKMISGVKPISKQYLMPLLVETKAETKERTRGMYGFGNMGLVNVEDIQKNLSIPAITQITGQKTLQKQKLGLKALGFGSFGAARLGFNIPFEGGFGFTPPPFILPKFGLLDFEKRGKSKPKKFRGQYSPNIASIAMGIFSTKIPKSYRLGGGALFLRPQIFPKGRKQKKIKVINPFGFLNNKRKRKKLWWM